MLSRDRQIQIAHHTVRRIPPALDDRILKRAGKLPLKLLNASTMPGSPADFGRLIADETERWGKVIRTAGVKAE